MSERVKIIHGDCLEVLRTLPDESVQCCVTSPPYWGLRDYGVDGQMGLEKTPEEYVQKMVEVFREVRRVLRGDGTCWLNLGDSYAVGHTGSLSLGKRSDNFHFDKDRLVSQGKGNRHEKEIPTGLKPKDIVGIPWRVAFALQSDGWWLRQDIIWNKPNPMPESVTDRCTKAHEYIFLLTKSARYFYDAEAVKEESVTNDPRRPYGSKGAWDMDGRPIDQQHGGEQRSLNGSKFHTGKTAEHQLNRASVNRKRGEFNGKTNDLPGREAFRSFTEMRNKRSVWCIPTQCYTEAHFATFPPDLIKPCILAGSRPGDMVLDPFGGSGTTGMVALELGRKSILIELNPKYVDLIRQRTNVTPGLALA